MRKLKTYKPTRFKAKDSRYSQDAADFAVMFIEQLCHTKGTWAGKKFELLDWQEQIIRDVFGILKPNGYRQFNTAYIEIPQEIRDFYKMYRPSPLVRAYCLEEKLQTRTRYIQYVDYPVDFRRAIHLQVGQLVKAVEENDSSIYTPITIR